MNAATRNLVLAGVIAMLVIWPAVFFAVTHDSGPKRDPALSACLRDNVAPTQRRECFQ